MKNHKKLIWERVHGTYDLRVTNTDAVDARYFADLLQKVEMDYPDYAKPFNKAASMYFREWIAEPERPLREAAYCLLSNWFLTEPPASDSTRAFHARNLWDALFSCRPRERLTDWRVSGRKVVPDRFERCGTSSRNVKEESP